MIKVLTCNSIDSRGQGILYHEGTKGYFRDILIGETFECDINNNQINIIKRITDSPERVVPFCPYYDKCGGCQLQAMSYQAQIDYKKEVIRKELSKYKINTTINDTVASDNPKHYRTKLLTTYSKNNKNQLIAGFYEENTHKLINVTDCPIQNKLGNKTLKLINSLLIKHKIEAYDEDRRTGVIRHLLIRVGIHTDEVLVCFVIGSEVFPGINNILKELKKQPNIKSVYLNYNNRKTSAVLGNKFKLLYGKKTITDTLLGLNYNIGPDTFYQVNPHQTEKLYQIAVEKLDLNEKDVLLDCYSGIGTIALTAAKYAKEVIGVELNQNSVTMANENKRLNNINNATFIVKDAKEFILQNNQRFNKLIVDPPRLGLDKAFIDAINKIKPEKIVYVSCNPITLARDLDLFKINYNIEIVTPVDMFSQTYHVENIVLLSLKTA
ncbi:MAG: 23S rRNA (uracil(1939)-C(5))-methyltransferase RlmD [Candidatus Caldatribacteriota bacterium]